MIKSLKILNSNFYSFFMIDSCFVEKTNEICDLEGFRREKPLFWISSVDIVFDWFFLFSFYILHKNTKKKETNNNIHFPSQSLFWLVQSHMSFPKIIQSNAHPRFLFHSLKTSN